MEQQKMSGRFEKKNKFRKLLKSINKTKTYIIRKHIKMKSKTYL